MSQPATTGKRLATVREACAYARMGRTRLYAKINQGTVVAYKDGKKTLIDLDTIDTSLQRIEARRK